MMKLRLIAESLSDNIALQQSIDNLKYTVLTKIRKMSGALGLNKSEKLHTVKEPVPVALTAINNLRSAVSHKVDQQAASLEAFGLNSAYAKRIEEYWGYRLPKNWYDPHGQYGSATVGGRFDKLLRRVVARVANKSVEEKIAAINDLANYINGL